MLYSSNTTIASMVTDILPSCQWRSKGDGEQVGARALGRRPFFLQSFKNAF